MRVPRSHLPRRARTHSNPLSFQLPDLNARPRIAIGVVCRFENLAPLCISPSPLSASWRTGYQKYGASKLEDGNRTRVVFPNSAILLRSIFLSLSLSLGIRRRAVRTRNNEWLRNFHGSKFCGHRSLLTRTVRLLSSPSPHGIFIRDFWIVARPF